MTQPTQKIKTLTTDTGANKLAIIYADIETISFLPDNIKSHDTNGIKESIRLSGFVEPIGINRRTGHDIFGNGRLECLLQMLKDGEPCPNFIQEKLVGEKGKEKRKWFAPVVDGLDFSEGEELNLAIRMNVLNERGGIDPKKAFEVLSRIKAFGDGQLEQTGYSEEMLEGIKNLAKLARRGELQAEAKEDSDYSKHGDRVIEDEEGERLNSIWGVAPGDLWKAGDHYLLCGDSLSAGDLTRLLADCVVRLEFSDPPYDLNTKGGGLLKNKPHLIGIDREGLDKFDPLTLSQIARTSVFFCNKPLLRKYFELADKWKVVWDLCFYKKESVTPNTNGHLMTDVEYMPVLGEQNPHGGMEKEVYSKGYTGKLDEGYFVGWQKPVALAEKFIRLFTLPGEVVLDRFLGTGTTMVAAENFHRVCRGIEKNPNKCAIALERMKKTFPEMKITREVHKSDGTLEITEA